MSSLPRLVLAVCTYRRNDQLAALLDGAVVAARAAESRATVGVVIVDDTAEGLARPIVERYAAAFPLGCHYRIAGHQNISKARNLGLDTALGLGDWVAMTDDDCVPDPQWFNELLAAQARTGASAISGQLVRRAPASAPRWLREQPFLDQGVIHHGRDDELGVASTHNSMLSLDWLRAHSEVRFAEHLGRVGGEDMHFYRHATSKGLRITFAPDAMVFEDQIAERCGYRYQLRNAWWLGNSRTVTYIESGAAGRLRLFVHAAAEAGKAALRPVLRLARKEKPQLRYALTRLVEAAGIAAGSIGIRLNHH